MGTSCAAVAAARGELGGGGGGIGREGGGCGGGKGVEGGGEGGGAKVAEAAARVAAEEAAEAAEAMAEVAGALTVGDRCEVHPGGKPATVRYVGKIPTIGPGWWVGVQYDKAIGKNNGSVKGERLFQCPPKCGGFLRPDKVTVVGERTHRRRRRRAEPPVALRWQSSRTRSESRTGRSRGLSVDEG